ncbi:helicase [Aureococcus anophagefferens]|nr:helicase [Aureococcus anophagefferens]
MGMLLQLCALVALPKAAPLLQPTARRAPRLTRLRAVGNEALSAKSWEAVGASAEMVGAAVACGAGDGPTKIQAMCYAVVANNKDCLIADQTGSGKTLAYLLPVFGVARAVSASGAAVRARRRGRPTADAARALKRGGGACDILIATPGRLAKLLDMGAVSLARAGDVVLDEVDVLALADDGAALKPILSADGVGAEARFVFVTATLPKRVEKQLRDEFEGLETFKGPGLHRAPLGLSVALVDCSAPREPARAGSSSGRRRPADDDLLDLDAIFEEDVAEGKPARKPSRDKKGRNGPKAAPTRQEAAATKKVDAVFERKKAALLESLTLGRAPVDGSAATAGLGAAARSLVFCNTIESCRRVENALKRADRRGRDRSLLAYHSALPADARRRNLGTFAAASSKKPASAPATGDSDVF